MVNEPRFYLEGRSGCVLELNMVEGRPVVTKYAKDEAYNARLVKQANKQADFAYPNSAQFAAPAVLSRQFENMAVLHSFQMEYQYGLKYSDYVERISIPEIDTLAQQFIQYFEHYRAQYTPTPVPKDVLDDKVASVARALAKNELLDKELARRTMSFLRSQRPEMPLEQGPCHGDFTLSNMIFQPTGKVFLIDFLDSFVESPLIDLVKLRQDTEMHWSLMIEGELPRYRRNKIQQVLYYLDQKLVQYCTQVPSFEAWYLYFQVFNLVRILPYVHTPHEVAFVESHITRLLP